MLKGLDIPWAPWSSQSSNILIPAQREKEVHYEKHDE